jgi:hypothetical protein
MGGRGSGPAIPVVVGASVGRLTIVAELAPDPHYGKRARYRCACGNIVEQLCAQIRTQRRRLEARAARRGDEVTGPSCRACATWGAA